MLSLIAVIIVALSRRTHKANLKSFNVRSSNHKVAQVNE